MAVCWLSGRKSELVVDRYIVHNAVTIPSDNKNRKTKPCFFGPSPFAFRRVYGTWDLLVYHVTIRGPVRGGNRSAASCLCTVLRRALYHYATRLPKNRKTKPNQRKNTSKTSQNTQHKTNREGEKWPADQLCNISNWVNVISLYHRLYWYGR